MKLLFAAILALLVSMNAFAFTGVGKVGTTQNLSSAAAGTVLESFVLPASGSHASTPSANYVVGINWYCSAATTFLYEVLNTSLVAVTTITLPCAAASRGMYSGPPTISFGIPDGYTLEVVTGATYTGFAQAEIYYAIEGLN